jgi:hypothetical protein
MNSEAVVAAMSAAETYKPQSGQHHIVRNSAYFKKLRKAAKSHTTDLNQAEDIPPLGSAPLPDPQSENQISG